MKNQNFINNLKHQLQLLNDKFLLYKSIDKEFIILKPLIDSNNLHEIEKTIDFIPKHLAVNFTFLYMARYTIEDKLKKGEEILVNDTIDFDALRIQLYEISERYTKAEQEWKKLDESLSPFVERIISTDDLPHMSGFLDIFKEHSSIISYNILIKKIHSLLYNGVAE